ncbi:phosphoadenosine phosphosulfate reductase family protein [Sphingomonas sp.]|jgi:3'-phosphoadenosine 5'-phosphosulfate sulfotransferase (PAPS reductase)/FAD synthetase|uniref:phosphoadenosine phosphosulfate reductase family protein n=1 Tax=Sphingomonas sp. TaxID=28214 RepID=UPI0025E88E7B|nr:phosphoadenosine phosphosulfate reductase family protein [Sphingomonas sp.]
MRVDRSQLDMFAPGFAALAIDDAVRALIAGGAPVAYSLSGGKDSVSIAHATDRLLDRLGHPRDRRIAIHADLGRIEWQSTPVTVEAAAAAIGVPLVVVRRKAGDLISRWERRFELGQQRYAALETYHLTGPWSSASNRFCTAELKTQVILPQLLRQWGGTPVLSIVGIRREESPRRRLAPISKLEGKPWVRADGGSVRTWHPGVDLREPEVFAYIDRERLPLAEAYPLGSSRYGCAFCVLASSGDIAISARVPTNLGTLLHLVDMEATSTFSFQQDRWLGDVAPDLIPATLAMDLARGKAQAAERRQLEAMLPAGLKYVKGWPQRVPTIEEAASIGEVRARILAMHALDTPYRTPPQIRDRIAELHHAVRVKEAA